MIPVEIRTIQRRRNPEQLFGELEVLLAVSIHLPISVN